MACALPLAPHETNTYESLLQSTCMMPFKVSNLKVIALLHVHAMCFILALVPHVQNPNACMRQLVKRPAIQAHRLVITAALMYTI